MPAGGGGMSSFGGGGIGGANQSRRPKGSKTQLKSKPKKKKTAARHNRGFNLYGMSGGKGSSMQSARRGKKPFSPAKARNIG